MTDAQKVRFLTILNEIWDRHNGTESKDVRIVSKATGEVLTAKETA